MAQEKASIVFFGTPEFTLPCLQALLDSERYQVLAVVTQPDRPAGRGQHLTPPAVKVLAEARGVPVFQPVSLKTLTSSGSGEESNRLLGEKSSAPLADFLNTAAADIFLTCAYGKIIPSCLIDFPRQGMVNIHPSLLPRWRGAAPLQWTLFSGDTIGGVSVMKVDEGLDTGPVYRQREISIAEDETFGTLHDKLAPLGAELMVECLPEILAGTLRAVPQPEEGATYAEKWENEDLEIRWSEPALASIRRIRASAPLPGARTTLAGTTVKIYQAHAAANQNFTPAEAGTIVEANKAELIVACGQGEYIALDEMQFPGKNRLLIAQLLRGRSFKVGETFGS